MTLFIKRIGLFFLVVCSLSVQSQKKEELKIIQDAFPNKKCYAFKQEQDYSFDIKNGELLVQEEFASVLFTPETNYSRYQTVFYDDFSEVKKINCSSIPEVNVIYTNYQNDGIFHDDLKLCAFQMDMKKKITYEVSYTKLYKNPRLFTRVFFHEDYPILEKTITFKIPEWLKMEIMPINFSGYTITENKKQSGKSTEIKYTITKAAAIPNESHAPGILKYLPHLLIFIKSYEVDKQTVTLFRNHDDVYDWNKKLANQVENNEEELKPILANIIKNEKDSLKMLEKIFYWVQDNVRYIAFEDGIMGYKPAGASKVCNLLYGDCKGMANLTKTLLKMAGFDARLTWIGTDNIPYENNLPTLAVYNHMICTAFLKGKTYFLDATESYIALDDYAERIQSRPCMIENGATYTQQKIPDLSFERNLQKEVYNLRLQNSLLIGKSETVYNGEVKTDFLRSFNDMRSDNIEKAMTNYLTNNHQNLKVKSIKTSDINNRAAQLSISYDLELNNSVVQTTSNLLFVFVNKDKELATLDFDSTRVTDYVFNSKYFIDRTLNFEIPSGYQVSKLPSSLLVDKESFVFDLKIEQRANEVIMRKVVKIKNGYLQKKEFEEWNEAIEQARKFYNSPIVLTKK